MMSNVGVYSFPGDYGKDLRRAYEGEVPAPYYRLPDKARQRRSRSRYGGGEAVGGMPYPFIPPAFAGYRVVSIEFLEESLERMARREEAD